MEHPEIPAVLIEEDDSYMREFRCKAPELERYLVVSAEGGEAGRPEHT